MFKRNPEGGQMTASIMPRLLYMLQELEEKSRQVTIQDFGTVCCLFRTYALTSYDIDLNARTCSYR